MYLQKLEIQGFKSFADKAELDFLPPSATTQGITAIVGPNGSGKSNVADALRWVLGEQSLKLLRGKRADDVIFSGSEKRPRSGFSEVTIHLNNEDGKIPIEYTEVAITRRIYRDGESEYLINKSKVRLSDIQLLLAQAQFGARTYAVIAQGMADAILVASPAERKDYLDEAAGVRQFQLKRQQSVSKMELARENLTQAEMLLGEIEPRLRSLARQIKRLEQRGELEAELHGLGHQYYGRLWNDLDKQLKARQETLAKLEAEWQSRESTMTEAQGELAKLESEEEVDEGFAGLQAEYQKLMDERGKLREREMAARGKLEVAEQVRKTVSQTLPLSQIIKEVGGISEKQDSAIGHLRSAADLEAAKATVPEFEAVHGSAKTLRERLERPAPETKPAEADPALVKELEEVRATLATLDGRVSGVQKKINDYSRVEREKKQQFFALQRGLREKIDAAHAQERRLGDERVELARLETRRETLEQEMTTELGERSELVKTTFDPSQMTEQIEQIQAQIQKVKYQLNLIGGIDPEAVREYEETRQRHEFLLAQVTDLAKAIADLEKVIAQLDEEIKQRSETAFRKINRDFDRYFKALFGGGNAELLQMMEEPEEEEDSGPEAGSRETGEEEKKEEKAKPAVKPAGDRVVGIDIAAHPPGKKIKNIAMLSGGERTLVSIALICAILTANPSPFVVLDEVDAALDESNSDKFAEILEGLAAKTQFIIITHNRYTMKRSNVLYGVTMRDDGASMLLSVNLDDVANLRNQAKEKVKI